MLEGSLDLRNPFVEGSSPATPFGVSVSIRD